MVTFPAILQFLGLIALLDTLGPTLQQIHPFQNRFFLLQDYSFTDAPFEKYCFWGERHKNYFQDSFKGHAFGFQATIWRALRQVFILKFLTVSNVPIVTRFQETFRNVFVVSAGMVLCLQLFICISKRRQLIQVAWASATIFCITQTKNNIQASNVKTGNIALEWLRDIECKFNHHENTIQKLLLRS